MDTIAFLVFCLAIAGVIGEVAIAERAGRPGGVGGLLAMRRDPDSGV
ncbi:MAG: hypothetical protein ACK51F_20930 [Rhodospirillales bacterium]|jgi:hypothetical protein